VNQALTESELEQLRHSVNWRTPLASEGWVASSARRIDLQASLRPPSHQQEGQKSRMSPFSIVHSPLIPLPLPREVLRRCSRSFAPSMAFAHSTLGPAPPCSHFRGGTYEAAGFTLCYGLKGCSSSSDLVTSLRCQNFARHWRLATWPPGGYHGRTCTC
jgi:hypothetical protein